MIASLHSLHDIFSKMADEGWDTSLMLKWGFFFFDKDKDKLLSLFTELEGHAYQLEELHQASDADWVLHVSKLDVLTPEKLHRRNVAFNELADHCSVELYDGWDVGQIE
ncbi:ribonuclease E inhibitor RraB [Hymenobacter sp. BT186]|uniref:Ribonuclease E inhibitor RraB n=1 Tax=Hymenobacter telluris TaxID=2816474 RepID=A0A939EZD6_9BACT|nr:ribonuclease E inhibitor RraB [Hymenobacter telluris]MBO0360273.1 ribonuclease E inhibitor RraB [Hymenobacter telluris]MBW3376300.1 ribonuclease E inhibitor RraB [Hymenobacter norwichensis]